MHVRTAAEEDRPKLLRYHIVFIEQSIVQDAWRTEVPSAMPPAAEHTCNTIMSCLRHVLARLHSQVETQYDISMTVAKIAMGWRAVSDIGFDQQQACLGSHEGQR